jgi:hypothetical protein
MNDKHILLASAVLVIYLFVGGLMDILDHFLSKMILFVGLLGIVIYIVVAKAKEVDE